MPSSESFLNILQKYIPKASLEYCVQLWEKQPFNFKVAKDRVTKLGDYRFDPRYKTHSISVNGSQNIYAFLITYIHEYAHLITKVKYNYIASPHGKEWKSAFSQLMQPLLTTSVFPEEILIPLTFHMKNPKASSTSDVNLMKALKSFDQASTSLKETLFLEEILDGETFAYRNDIYLKQHKRRTRYLCTRLNDNAKLLFSPLAEVHKHNGKTPESLKELIIEKKQRRQKLINIPDGMLFKLGEKTYEKNKLRRTRVLCTEQRSQVQYLIHKDALVEKI
ncbi:transcription elongation protein SprT [Aureibacter tunicatorum]|uniref:SprT-like family protein n=1 Tax=Aureibacter tunicatorum TaxID=866807 RepID=A0AAE4BR57_9BACT|nr:transcription elongation protein SprT [Aureibacter tunicatorum]MDR6238316.1 hypothetical protein [Aureibacter tunicatorum]BDD03348.1 hypothetical protein AUTU_08310 [Aureibacter tunicatorum]